MEDLLVVVIDSGTGRSISLLNKLEKVVGVRVYVLNATMLREAQDLINAEIEYSDTGSRKLLRRSLTLPEIGCADSHNQARELLSNSEYGGVILEDDARICDVTAFIQLSRIFLVNLQGQSAVLNHSNSASLSQTCSSHEDGRLSFRKLLAPSPLAVGYACTPSGAKQLFLNNTPIRYVSDWPNRNVAFYGANHDFVHHGDGSTVSTIDPSQSSARNQKSVLRSASILLGFDFVSYTYQYGLDFSYFKDIWWKTFAHKISFLRGRKFFVQ